ncbi:DNA polymerase III subunit gamma/tau [Candidatus Mesenet endosymbiont of Agriotes lineatus]|uniref:DNA polymerase III subunit gamma/tau n=1 Tax=Candidatus Mesenet endosymbiont of Agriotes lineatus TaxID=3077948 RepID=UPI0030D3F769
MNIAAKYRPNTFEELVGQDVLVHVLRNSFILNKIPQSILLAGGSGIGKTTTARIIALCLNCSSGPTPYPCKVCNNCTAIKNSRHPDVLEIDAASRTSVEDIKAILESTHYLPVSAKFKVYIIDEVHMLSNSAFNALLKTLEEPLPNVKFILATTEARKIPSTVISRCQCFNLEKVQANDMMAHLSNIAKEETLSFEIDALKLITRNSEGSVRNALFLLNQVTLYSGKENISIPAVEGMLCLTDRKTLFDLVESLLDGNTAETLITFKRACKNANTISILEELLQIIHLLCCFWITGLKDETVTEYEMVRITKLDKKKSLSFILRLWQALFKGIQNIKMFSCSDLFAEMILINLCYLADLPSPTQVINSIFTNKSGYQDSQILYNREREEDYDFNKILTLLDQNKEVFLYNQLCNSIELISCSTGYLKLKAKVLLYKNFATTLKQCLNSLTQIEWCITIDGCVEVFENIPAVKKVLDIFKSAKIKDIKKRSDCGY